MNKKLLIFFVIIVLVSAASYFLLSEKNISKFETYENTNHKFTFRVPDNFVVITQDDYPDLSTFYLIDKDDKKIAEDDPIFKENPLLAILDQDINAIELRRFTPDYQIDFIAYLSDSISGPNGEVDVILKNFTKKNTANGQIIYLYTQERSFDPPQQVTGAIWISNGVTFELISTGNSTNDPYSEEEIFEIAETFSNQ